MTAALLVGPGVVVGAFVILYATTLLDRLTLASTFDQPTPIAPAVQQFTAPVTGEPAISTANSTTSA